MLRAKWVWSGQYTGERYYKIQERRWWGWKTLARNVPQSHLKHWKNYQAIVELK